MHTYKIFRLSTSWSTSSLMKKVEKMLAEKEGEGWEVVSVAFGTDLWQRPSAFVTLRRNVNTAIA